jgi:hypothetical protein
MARNGKNTHVMRGDDRQTTVLADMPPAKESEDGKEKGAAKEPKPILFRTAHDITITGQALEHRVEFLKAAAKKVHSLGYRRQARDILADVDAIQEHVIPSLRTQRELPLKSEEDAERSIKGGIRTTVFRAFDGLDDVKVVGRHTPEAIQRRREELCNALVGRVHTFAMELINRSYNAGYAARKTDPEVLITEAAKELSTERVD